MRNILCLLTGFLLLTALLLAAAPYKQTDGAESQPSLTEVFQESQSKRYHQETLRRLLEGRHEPVRDFLQARLRTHPNEVESRFMLVLALASLGDLNRADAEMKRSIEDGLPPGRFAAGPPKLFEPMRELTEYRKLLENFRHLPVHGPMVGSLEPDSASVWLRTAEEAVVQVEAVSPEGEVQYSEVRQTSSDSDWTTVLKLHGLRANQNYRYSVLIHGERSSSGGSFRTPPAGGSPLKFRFAFGGGAGYVPDHERVWTTIRRLNPDSLILLGDNVYIDDPATPPMQRYTYYRRQSRPEWRQLVRSLPVYSIWDDHDFATNDSSGGPRIDDPPWKIPVWQVFRQNWVNPAYGGGLSLPGCWYDFQVGDIHFIMLDGRYYRHLPSGSMLGPDQKRWLKKTLADSEATFKILASPVPWAQGTKPGSRDTWDGFPEEREEIFNWIAEEKVTGAVLISADRHRSDAYRIERFDSGAYDLFEFSSSRLTNEHVHPTMEHAIFSYNATQSFGLVEVDTTVSDPIIRYTVMTIDGEAVHSLLLRHSQLQ